MHAIDLSHERLLPDRGVLPPSPLGVIGPGAARGGVRERDLLLPCRGVPGREGLLARGVAGRESSISRSKPAGTSPPMAKVNSFFDIDSSLTLPPNGAAPRGGLMGGPLCPLRGGVLRPEAFFRNDGFSGMDELLSPAPPIGEPSGCWWRLPSKLNPFPKSLRETPSRINHSVWLTGSPSLWPSAWASSSNLGKAKDFQGGIR